MSPHVSRGAAQIALTNPESRARRRSKASAGIEEAEPEGVEEQEIAVVTMEAVDALGWLLCSQT